MDVALDAAPAQVSLPNARAGDYFAGRPGSFDAVPRITANARHLPPEIPHKLSKRERLLNAGIVLLLVYFVMFVALMLILAVALLNQ